MKQRWLLPIKGFVLLDGGHARSPAIGKPSWRSMIAELIWIYLELLHAILFMSGAFLVAGEVDLIWKTDAVSEPDQTDNYRFLRRTASFNWNAPNMKENTRRPRNLETESTVGGLSRVHVLMNKRFSIYSLLPDLIDRSAFLFMDRFSLQ